MTTLHLINKSPSQAPAFESCLKRATINSSLLFFEDGVFALHDTPINAALLTKALKEYSVYGLRQDIEARGLQAFIHPEVILVGYEEFVALTLSHKRVQSWN